MKPKESDADENEEVVDSSSYKVVHNEQDSKVQSTAPT
jgi:hypothetical protein